MTYWYWLDIHSPQPLYVGGDLIAYGRREKIVTIRVIGPLHITTGSHIGVIFDHDGQKWEVRGRVFAVAHTNTFTEIRIAL